MSIPFTQFLRPDGRRTQTEIDMPMEIEAMAHRFVAANGWYESEMLGDHKHVSLTACFALPDDPEIAIIATEVVENGPAVVDAVEKIVRASIDWLAKVQPSAREIAPAPWRIDTRGAPSVCDANGQTIAWIAARLNVGDESWRVIAAQLAAALETREALMLLLREATAAGFATATDCGWPEAFSKARAALAKAAGQ